MGGKPKQSQRTKNNVRPSSSGRSAEILHNTLKLDSSVVSPTTGKVLPALFPTLIPTSPEHGLSPELSICFKKFTKKDPITKTKALQELTELIKSSNVDDVATVLPSWAHFYPTLTIDSDRKVRETAQLCHGAIVAACGRRVAPHLRRLLPAWLLACHDDHAPAQSAAKRYLESTFPEAKLEEAFSFCKLEIVSLLLDNLMGNAEAMLSKKIEEEERASSISRVMCSSLRALEQLVRTLAASHDDWLWESLAPLIRANAYWKLATHDDARLRGAWYCATGRISARFGPRLEGELGTKISRALVAQPEQAPAVAAERWAAVLLLMHSSPDWSKWMDKKDLLIKRLLTLLENGGWGEARSLSDTLLPLLSQLPQDLLTQQFYITLFDALLTGLKSKALLNSKIERQAWINIIAECIRYLSIQSDEYVTEVVTYAHRTCLEHVLTISDDRQKQDLIKQAANDMASLLKFWLKQSKENAEKYDQLIRNFWQNTASTISSSINKLSMDQEQIVQAIDDHILLLKTMQKGFMQVARKRSIKFEDEAAVADVREKTIECDASMIGRFKHNMDDLVSRVCCQYFTFAKEKQVSRAVFPSLYNLLSEFDSEALFVTLAKHVEADTVYGLYEKELRAYLAGDTMRCKTLVDIVFMAAKYLSEPDQCRMFSSFQQFPPSVVEWCISRALCDPSPAALVWLQSGTVEATLVGLSRREDDAAVKLLLRCVTPNHGGVILVNEGTVSKIIKSYEDALSDDQASSEQTSKRLLVAQKLCCAVASSVRRQLCVPLLMTVFRLYLKAQVNEENESENERQRLRDAISALDTDCRRELATSALVAAHEQLQPNKEKVDLPKIEHVVSLSLDLLPETVEDLSEVLSFAELLLNLKTPKPKTPLEVFALRIDCIYGCLNCPIEDDNPHIKQVIKDCNKCTGELTKDALLLQAHRNLYHAYCLSQILSRTELDESTWNELLSGVYFKTEISQMVYDYVLLSSLEERYAFWPHYAILKQVTQDMKKYLDNTLSNMSTEAKNFLLEHTSELAATRGYYWSYTEKLLERKIIENTNKNTEDEANEPENSESIDNVDDKEIPKTEEKSEDYTKLLHGKNLSEIITGSGFFHGLQAKDKYSGESLDTLYVLMVRSAMAAHAQDAPLLTSLTHAAATRDIDALIDAYYQHNHMMLFEKNLKDSSWAHVVSNAAILDYLRALVASDGWNLSDTRWDFINIAICSILASVRMSVDNVGCAKVAILARSALRLSHEVRSFVSGVRERAVREEPAAHVIALPTEWTDIFTPDYGNSVGQITLKLLQTASKTMSAGVLAVIDELIPALCTLRWAELPPPVRAACSLEQIVRSAADALRRVTHHSYSYLAYYALEFVADALVEDDRDKLSAWSARGDDSARPAVWPAQLEPARCQLHTLLEAVLESVRVGEDTCHVVPFTDSHCVALAAMLLSIALHRLAERAEGDLHIVYIDHFRENSIAEETLSTSLRLVPDAVAALANEPQSGSTLPPHILALFNEGPDYKPGGDASLAVEGLACRALLLCLGGAGSGGARSWGVARPRVLLALRRLVPAAVAPSLTAAQLRKLHERAKGFTDAQVAIKWSSGEVTCSLGLEEHVLELHVRFAPDHPLTPPTITTSSNSPAPDTLWLSLYLGHQNGTLENAMKMWMKSVTGRVESASQCFICYCRMHPKSGHLPSVPCHQCRNKFHSACLRKWIATSGKSICPICRTHF
ncbi:E3 ubiquitin-protein ligase listerin [Aricia agestis]|uniref:E3 ubiquitin-protein ligase listerin n=1 Tax=Aricia agestis TaxID=91739 RepID=UPI001C20819A|nr:E3 ubiquitin-protein ligase listerin [Aricia agestis]